MTSLFELPTSMHLAPRFDLIHDLSTMVLLEQRAFQFFEMFLSTSAAPISTRVRRLAVVLPGGYAGEVLRGLAARWVAPLFAEFRLCERREQAYRLFDLGSGAVTEVDALYQAHEPPPLLVRLRVLLVASPGTSTLERCAAALTVSPRSLQRCLSTRRTNFRRELALARIRAACELLLDGAKVEVVARHVGFATGEAFASSFCKHTGESPRDYRDAMTRRTVP